VALFDTFGHARIGLERIDALVRNPAVHEVAVYTWHVAEQQVELALALGARGVIAKSSSSDELADALLRVSRGEVVVSREFRRVRGDTWPGKQLGLTEREGEVIACLANGLSNRDIGDAINISENTVKTHLKSIFQKLRVRSRTQAIARIQHDASFRRNAGAGQEPGRTAYEHSFG
jgi:DNA-binding NarL/FixJ family response regulator